MLGIGVDLITLGRMRDALTSGGDPFRVKVYSDAERRAADADPNPVARYAMIFAAKEAVFKAFAISWDDALRYTDIEIGQGPADEPTVILRGSFAALGVRQGVTKIRLSLSFDGDYAIAVAALA